MDTDIWKILKRFIKYKTLRTYIKYSKVKFEKEELTQTQEIGLKIARKLISCPDSEIVIAPLSEVCYIRRDDIYVKLTPDSLQIINGKYLYDIYIRHNTHSDLYTGILQRMEGKKTSIENKIKNRSTRSLQIILNEISSKTEENVKTE